MNKNEAAKDKLMQTEKCFEEDSQMAKKHMRKGLLTKWQILGVEIYSSTLRT